MSTGAWLVVGVIAYLGLVLLIARLFAGPR